MDSQKYDISYDSDDNNNIITPINDTKSEIDGKQSEIDDKKSENNINNDFMKEQWRMLRIVGGGNIIPPSLKC